MAQTQIHNVRGAGVRRGRACPGAAPAGAGEELSREGRLWAGRAGRAGRGHTAALLVRVVPAVVVVVALPAAWHAAVVLAAELVGLTGALVWKRQD